MPHTEPHLAKRASGLRSSLTSAELSCHPAGERCCHVILGKRSANGWDSSAQSMQRAHDTMLVTCSRLLCDQVITSALGPGAGVERTIGRGVNGRPVNVVADHRYRSGRPKLKGTAGLAINGTSRPAVTISYQGVSEPQGDAYRTPIANACCTRFCSPVSAQRTPFATVTITSRSPWIVETPPPPPPPRARRPSREGIKVFRLHPALAQVVLLSRRTRRRVQRCRATRARCRRLICTAAAPQPLHRRPWSANCTHGTVRPPADRPTSCCESASRSCTM